MTRYFLYITFLKIHEHSLFSRFQEKHSHYIYTAIYELSHSHPFHYYHYFDYFRSSLRHIECSQNTKAVDPTRSPFIVSVRFMRVSVVGRWLSYLIIRAPLIRSGGGRSASGRAVQTAGSGVPRHQQAPPGPGTPAPHTPHWDVYQGRFSGKESFKISK